MWYNVRMETNADTSLTPARLAAMIDHTFLQAAGAPDAVEKLCAEARRHRFACAMVNPCAVAQAVRLLRRSKVRVGTVVNFPLGQGSVSAAVAEAELAMAEGAQDIDIVIDVRKLKYGDAKALQRDLAFLAAVCRCPGVISKLIIECCYLTDREKVKACRLAKKAGFDFVKTSTGFGTGGATVHDVALMRRTVGPAMGVKAAGGIRTLADARALIAAGATRLGCSAGVALVKELKRELARD